METPKSKSPVWVPIISILMIIAIFFSGLYLEKSLSWAFVMLFMIVFIALIGWLITGRFSAIFINERNKMTLSRFQLVIWTLIVLSAFLTIALARVKTGSLDPLAIALPPQLWALLGISTAALVGSPLILSTKVQKTPTPAAKINAAKLLVRARAVSDREIRNTLADAEQIMAAEKKPGVVSLTSKEIIARRKIKADAEQITDAEKEPDAVQLTPKETSIRNEIKADAEQITDAEKEPGVVLLTSKEIIARRKIKTDAERIKNKAENDIETNVDANGILDSNKNFGDAKFSEMFTGDEIASKGLIDMAKVQMFFFTIIIAFSYMVLLVNLIMTTEPAGLNGFPALSDSMVALLGISSAGYLTNKTADHTKTM